MPLFALVYQCKHAAQVTAHNIVSTLWRWSAMGYDVRQQVRPPSLPVTAALPVGRRGWLYPSGEWLQLNNIQAATAPRRLMSTLIVYTCGLPACSQAPEHLPTAAVPSSRSSGAQASLNLLCRSAALIWAGPSLPLPLLPAHPLTPGWGMCRCRNWLGSEHTFPSAVSGAAQLWCSWPTTTEQPDVSYWIDDI